MKNLSPQTRRLLDLAQHEDDPTPDVQVRVERSLRRKVGLSLAAVAGGAAVSKPAVGAGLFAIGIKSATVAGVTCGVLLLGYEALQSPSRTDAAPAPFTQAGVARPQSPRALGSHETPAARESEAPAVALPSHAGEKAPESPAPSVQRAAVSDAVETSHRADALAPKAVANRDSVPPRNEQSTADLSLAPEVLGRDRLAEEVRALRDAQRALRNGDSRRALTLLEQQQARYGSGALGQERSAARVLALCQAGQRARARRAAAQFERSFPRSPLLGRVRDACAP